MTRRLDERRVSAVVDTALRGVTGLAIVAAMLAAVWVAHSSEEDRLGGAPTASGPSGAGTAAAVPAVHTEGKPTASTLSSARAFRDRVYRTAIAPPGVEHEVAAKTRR